MKQCYYGNRGEKGYHLLEESDSVSDSVARFLERMAEKYSDIGQGEQCTQLLFWNQKVFLQHVTHQRAGEGSERPSVFCHQIIWDEEEYETVRPEPFSVWDFCGSVEELRDKTGRFYGEEQGAREEQSVWEEDILEENVSEEGVPEEDAPEDRYIPMHRAVELRELLDENRENWDGDTGKLFLVLGKQLYSDREILKMLEEITRDGKSFSFSTRAGRNWDFSPFQILCCREEEFSGIYAVYTNQASYYEIERDCLRRAVREEKEDKTLVSPASGAPMNFQIELEELSTGKESDARKSVLGWLKKKRKR